MSTSTKASDYYGNFVDWGKPYCISKGIAEGTWTTLSGGENGEWKYLFDHHIHVRDTCNEVPGRFIAPDGFKGDATALSEAIKDWENAQKSGIVFLPAAGSRDSSSVSNVGSRGRCWSSTISDNEHAYVLNFNDKTVYHGFSAYRYYGHSVRLITEVK